MGQQPFLPLPQWRQRQFPEVRLKRLKTNTQTTTTQVKPQASDIKKSSDIDDQVTVLQKLVTEKVGQKKFNEQDAKDAGASDLILESGSKYDAISKSRNGTHEFVVRGNYRGPNHSEPGAPIDPLDRLFEEHDKCYGKKDIAHAHVTPI